MDAINNSVLTWILLAPLAGAILIAILPDRGKLAAWVGLITTLVTFGLTLHLPAHFIAGQPGFQFEINKPWIDLGGSADFASHSSGIAYHVGVDGLSMWLVVLSGLLGPVGVLASWNAIKERKKVFYSLFMVQQTAMFGVFVALDLMVYYGFWELTLVPMAVLMAMYGRKNGPAAATKFFLFTFIPSAPLLVAILWLWAKTGTFNFVDLRVMLASSTYSGTAMFWVALAFLFAFAVKVPVFPLHGWLADSFSEAPVALSMVIAGKLGLYSMIRFHVGLFPAQAKAIAPTLIVLTVIGVIYGACLALVQRDFWKLIAFATVSHFSLITLGVYGFTLAGRDGAVFQTLNEGVIEGALFVLLGVLDTRYRTSQIASYGGVAAKLPRTATFFVITSLAMVGLPLMNGFIGEFLILSSTFTGVNKGWAIVATVTVILGAAYVLWLVQRLFYGPESPMAATEPVHDLRVNEWVALAPLAVLMLVMGVAPNVWLRAIEDFEGPVRVQLVDKNSPAPQSVRMVISNVSAEAK
ncbi:complex I subunit 4 family protein [Occallatibacter riparius]|uniref:NADH-quinone oxidoreductase subunit M n=1 Tax=Occallatibacter riparius TaxID=1002689 RepID=A0A9J7BKD0_9BACT|nr:NADH-quinone oxidoreductase subunit M [Occallatibacter riparius]UWZ82897.1 NADH-quinone oxidoreductase subunit M [Occallatibacter riparius]